jgi:hypothetical protein
MNEINELLKFACLVCLAGYFMCAAVLKLVFESMSWTTVFAASAVPPAIALLITVIVLKACSR